MNIDPAINTLKASRFTLLLAKWLGREIVKYEEGYLLTLHLFRGVVYLTGYEKVK